MDDGWSGAEVDIWPTTAEVERRRLAERLLTFSDWPSVAFVSKEDLARSGFTYTGHGDRVSCLSCRLILSHWERGDVPATEHRRHRPGCSFLAASSTTPPPLPPVATTYSTPPRYPNLATEPARLATFATWPGQIRQRPEKLAAAGLFYTTKGDQVQCFHCGGRLNEWLREDNIFEEHARWYPHCEYSRLVGGGEAVVDDSSSDDDDSSDEEEKRREEKRREEKEKGFSFSRLRQETERLRDKNRCKICMERDACVVFRPCKHLLCCAPCSPPLVECPVCRLSITGKDKIFVV